MTKLIGCIHARDSLQYIYSLKFTVVNKMDGIFEKNMVTRIGDCVKVPLRYGSNEPMRKVSFGVKKSAVVESLVRSRRRLTTIKQQSVSGVNREQIRLFSPKKNFFSKH